MDFKNGYHLIRIKEGDKSKTAFRCRFGLNEYTVITFGLINAPAAFQAMINHVFRDMLDQGALAFMDDIIVVHSPDENTLDYLTREVLGRLKDNRLCIAPNKCEWAKRQVEFLGTSSLVRMLKWQMTRLPVRKRKNHLWAILFQKHDGGLHPVAFHSQKFSSAEINYDVCDKELLEIFGCFKRWRCYLEGARQVMITDHNNLELFMTTKILNCRQALWAQVSRHVPVADRG